MRAASAPRPAHSAVARPRSAAPAIGAGTSKTVVNSNEQKRSIANGRNSALTPAPAAAAAAPRPPKRAAPPSGGNSAASEMQVRRRLAEVEVRLRDIDEDVRRRQLHHEQELMKLELDNAQLRERLEGLRMEECMTASETRAMRDHITLAQGSTEAQHESKMIGALSPKYQQAKAEVDAARKECKVAEQDLADARKRLADLKQRRTQLKRDAFRLKATASAKMDSAEHFKVRAQEQLRGLEEQVSREQGRFGNLIVEAKELRRAIDGLLLTQSATEKTYRKGYDALLTKRKEMAFVMEMCNAMCEERQRVSRALVEARAQLAQEATKYEEAFEELNGVQAENSATQVVTQLRIDETRALITQTKDEREAIEAENNAAKAALDKRRGNRVGGRRLNGANSSGDQSLLHRPQDLTDEDTVAGRSVANSESGCETSVETTLPLDGHARQLRVLEDYFGQLAHVVQSDAIEDVVGFLDVAAEERYRCFEEVNLIKREIAQIESEKVKLRSLLIHGGVAETGGIENTVPPTFSSVAALAELTSIDALTAGDGGVQRVTRVLEDGEVETTVRQLTSAEAATRRTERLKKLQAELDKARGAVLEQEQQKEESAAVMSEIVVQVKEVFTGLGCSVDQLRRVTGLEGVQQSTLLACLALIEQRTEEYLIAYARGEHQQPQQLAVTVLGDASGGGRPGHATSPTPPAHNAARSILRRPDLLPKSRADGAVVAVSSQTLPRSTDVGASAPVVLLSESGDRTVLEDIVEERPLTEAEVREVVEVKRAQQQR